MHLVGVGSTIISFKPILNRTVPYHNCLRTFTSDNHITQVVRIAQLTLSCPFFSSRDYYCHIHPTFFGDVNHTFGWVEVLIPIIMATFWIEDRPH